MKNDPLIVRLAAANPVPLAVPAPAVSRPRSRRRQAVVALAVAMAVAIPAAAFADDIGSLLGLSTPGAPVPTSSLSLWQDTKMNEGMQELGFPATLHELATLNGFSFFAARRADGHYCFAIERDGVRQGGISCDLDGTFPSPQTPVWAFPPFHQLVGFAADGVASVSALDASGQVLFTAPVADNVFASTTPVSSGTPASVEAFDAQGKVIWTWRLPGGSPSEGPAASG